MYKVFFNDNSIFFTDKPLSPKELKHGIYAKFENDLSMEWLSNKYINQAHLHDLTLCSNDIEKVFNSFQLNFKVIKAGGGIILNSQNQFLGIFRRGKWDLPKGKLDSNESFEEGALRECKEETSLHSLILEHKLTETYHTYIEKTAVLKKTEWFLIRFNGSEFPIPQKEEDITAIKWFDKYSIDEFLDNTYTSLKEVINAIPHINSWNF